MKNVISINGKDIEPGESSVVRIPVGRLPSGTRIYVYAHVFRALKKGPVMLVLGGMHGDEVNGIEIVRKAISQGMFEQLTKGTVIAVPLLNIYGFLNFSRDVPDGKDVNRSFPGSLRGSLASRVARTLTKHILPHVDFGIDFHTGGAGRYNFPQIRYSRNKRTPRQLALKFGAPYVVAKAPIPKSFRKISMDLGKHILVFEGGEALRYNEEVVEAALAGMQRLMFAQKMCDEHVNVKHDVVHMNKSTWIRAAHSGLFTWIKSSGSAVMNKEVLGLIKDPYGGRSREIKANRDGYIIGHNNSPVVNQGDALFHIAFESKTIM